MKAKSSVIPASEGTQAQWIELKRVGLEYVTHLCTEDGGRHYGHYFHPQHDEPGKPCAESQARQDYEKRCLDAGVEPYPQVTALEAIRLGLKAANYVHVHTWVESHGDYSVETYELKQRNGALGLPTLLSVSVYHDDRFPELRPERRDEGSFLLAREIKDNVDGRWEPVSAEQTSACCTAGHRDYAHKFSPGKVYRLSGVVGHGERAREISE